MARTRKAEDSPEEWRRRFEAAGYVHRTEGQWVAKMSDEPEVYDDLDRVVINGESLVSIAIARKQRRTL